MNPNVASRVGAGFNPVVFSEAIPEEAKAAILIPSKPLAKEEDTIRAIYERNLPPIYEKLKV